MKLSEVTIVESNINEAHQLDEFSWADVKKGAGKAAAGAKSLGSTLAAAPKAIQRGSKSIEKAANKYTKGVRQTGDAMASAANALGRAGAETFKQTVARPVSGMWDAGKQVAQAATGAVQKGYGDVKQGAQAVGQGAATALGDVGKAAGATASIPQGVARATKRGYEAGVNAIGGPDDKTLAAQKKAASRAAAKQAAPKSFAMPSGYSSTSYSLPGAAASPASQTSPVNQAMSAVGNLNKQGKAAVHQQLEKELYGNRSDSSRRQLARGAKIKGTLPQVAEGKDYKIWGQK